MHRRSLRMPAPPFIPLSRSFEFEPPRFASESTSRISLSQKILPLSGPAPPFPLLTRLHFTPHLRHRRQNRRVLVQVVCRVDRRRHPLPHFLRQARAVHGAYCIGLRRRRQARFGAAQPVSGRVGRARSLRICRSPPDLRNARVPDLEGGLLAVGAVSVPVRLPFGGLQDEFLAIASAASEGSATLPKKSIL